jgi:hypothetical protein
MPSPIDQASVGLFPRCPSDPPGVTIASILQILQSCVFKTLLR